MRQRFNRNAVASSRGSYVRHSHLSYLKEQHEKNAEYIAKIEITVKVQPKYYVKCFGKLMQVTEMETKMLGDLVITVTK